MLPSANDVHSIIGKRMLLGDQNVVVDLEKSHGSWIHDSRSGNDVLDMTSFFASTAIGLNHPALYNDEFIREIGKVAINKPTNSCFFTPELADLVQTFTEIGVPDYMEHLFFVEGGTLAVENALKVAFDWKHRKNLAAGRTVDENRLAIVHFKSAFHGRSGYTISLTNTSDPRKYMYFPKFDWPRIEAPFMSFPLTDEGLKKLEADEAACLRGIRNFLSERPHEIAGLIIESIMGEGGDRHFRPEFFQALRQLCNEEEVFFIVDEVQSGIGMTGKFWAYEHYGIEPDAIAFGKKAQVCGILVGPRIHEVEKHVFAEASRINSTWGGNLVDMVRFRRTLEVIRDENLLENATQMGNRLVQGLRALESRYVEMHNARGLGLLCAFDLPVEKRQPLLGTCKDLGMLALPCGKCSIRLRPHLAVPQEDIDRCLEILEAALSKHLTPSVG
jgi:L-lysine 6-transaminase